MNRIAIKPRLPHGSRGFYFCFISPLSFPSRPGKPGLIFYPVSQRRLIYAVAKLDELRHKDPVEYRRLLLMAGGKTSEETSWAEKLMEHDAYKRKRGRIRQVRHV